jgi:hypothetical protein
LMETSSSVSILMNEAVEVIEAAEVPDAREITQCAKCKVSFSAKMRKKLITLKKN